MVVNISPSPTIPQGLLPLHQSSSDNAGNTGREGEASLTPPELPSKTFNGRAAPTLPSNGRDVRGLPVNIGDVSGPLKDG